MIQCRIENSFFLFRSVNDYLRQFIFPLILHICQDFIKIPIGNFCCQIQQCIFYTYRRDSNLYQNLLISGGFIINNRFYIFALRITIGNKYIIREKCYRIKRLRKTSNKINLLITPVQFSRITPSFRLTYAGNHVIILNIQR